MPACPARVVSDFETPQSMRKATGPCQEPSFSESALASAGSRRSSMMAGIESGQRSPRKSIENGSKPGLRSSTRCGVTSSRWRVPGSNHSRSRLRCGHDGRCTGIGVWPADLPSTNTSAPVGTETKRCGSRPCLSGVRRPATIQKANVARSSGRTARWSFARSIRVQYGRRSDAPSRAVWVSPRCAGFDTFASALPGSATECRARCRLTPGR